MNRDLEPSFSLGFSQLESIKEYEDVVNFIPGSFDYESVGFDENRSKHRNDPHTMKTLRQKHAKKDKKKEIHGSKERGSDSSASKAPAKRRRVVEVISRDELPKAYVNYYDADVGKELATQDAFARTDEVAQMKMSLINTIKELSTPAGQSWHLVNEVFIPINGDGVFHWVLTAIGLKDQCIRVYDSMESSQKRTQGHYC
ncbi:hypothetical protein T459_04720 [Capsicum annuum]|uniref:Ubiquitin-like protease family profile domain-containing protein n=1 Tax=Capsicum annuum TaxID=4072 RepID=A0A2G3A5U1_CAPAN|nr:hypothetical protein T459_04720 [Capsicum annuum]